MRIQLSLQKGYQSQLSYQFAQMFPAESCDRSSGLGYK